MANQKKYLEVAKQARSILASKVPVNIQKARKQSVELKNIKTKKDALANSAFWLAVAKSQGENIPESEINSRLNKLKSKNNSSAIEIRQILNNTMGLIHNHEIRSLLTSLDQKKMVTEIAETVVQSLGSKNTIKEITKQNEQHGWAKFGIALFFVMAAKFLTQRR